MTLGLNTTGLAYPSNLDWCSWVQRLLAGVEGAATNYRSATAPDSGAPVLWADREAGIWWEDIGVDGSVLNPVMKRWVKLTSGPDTYGWKKVCAFYTQYLTAPIAITLSPAGPHAADVAFTTHSLAALFDAQADHIDAHRVVAALIDFDVKETGTVPANDTDAYLAVRSNGGTDERRIYCQVSSRPVRDRFWVVLDASEQFEWSVQVGTGTPNLSVAAQILAWQELQ